MTKLLRMTSLMQGRAQDFSEGGSRPGSRIPEKRFKRSMFISEIVYSGIYDSLLQTSCIHRCQMFAVFCRHPSTCVM